MEIQTRNPDYFKREFESSYLESIWCMYNENQFITHTDFKIYCNFLDAIRYNACKSINFTHRTFYKTFFNNYYMLIDENDNNPKMQTYYKRFKAAAKLNPALEIEHFYNNYLFIMFRQCKLTGKLLYYAHQVEKYIQSKEYRDVLIVNLEKFG